MTHYDWKRTASSELDAGPALGMFELFGRTGPPILGGPPFWTLKNLQYRRLSSTLFLEGF